jgi:GxxExxY protein
VDTGGAASAEARRALENRITDQIIGAAIEVHEELRAGLLESTYEACLCHELGLRGVAYERQRELPVVHKGRAIDQAYRLDLVVENLVIVEVKSVEELLPIHEAQLLTYLRLTGLRLGLLLNFNVLLLRDGIKRLVSGYL